MEKLTLSIHDKEKIAWVKAFAKENNTSVSQLFEKYVDSLKAFDQSEVKLSTNLQSLRQPGVRPKEKEIERHLARRRQRTPTK